MRYAVLLLASLLASSSKAVIINVFGGRTSNPPKYFSGTNCHATGFVDLTGEYDPETGLDTWVYEVRLYVGGFQVKSHFGDPEAAGTAGESVTFDSTHFANGTNLEVRFECTCSAGHIHSASDTVTVKNKSAIASTGVAPFGTTFIEWPPESGLMKTPGEIFAKSVRTSLEETNYLTSWIQYNALWTKTQLLDEIEPVNVLALCVHGDPAEAKIFDAAAPLQTGCMSVFFSDISGAKGSAVGAGLPPFNPTEVPPFNFVWLMSCKQGNFYDWIATLFPGYPYLTNQAVLAFKPYVSAYAALEMPTPFMQFLGNGFPLQTAITSFLDQAESLEYEEQYCSDAVGSDGTANPNSLRPFNPQDIVILGDPNMKTHGVYTGTDVPTDAWYL